MTLEQKVDKRLTETFFAKFNVKKTDTERCLVSIEDSDERYFQMDVLIREHSRIIISVVPEKHAAELVETLSDSSLQKRENFCDIWDNIEGKLKVKINDIERTKEDLLNNNFQWKNFSFRLSVPLYNESIDLEERAAELSCTMFSLVLSLVDYSLIGEEEGRETVTEELHKKRERSPINRQICIQLKGYNCSVCGMNFQEKYGLIGEHFIEIHHSFPVHMMQKGHEVDIKKELYPVCSNCHSMIHRRNPPYTIEEMVDILKKQAHLEKDSRSFKKKLESVEDDNEVRNLIYERLLINPDTSDDKLQFEVIERYGDRYPDMVSNDWRHIIEAYTPMVREANKAKEIPLNLSQAADEREER